MSEQVCLSQGVFVTFDGDKFRIGHVDNPYRVHEIGRRVLHVLATFSEPSDPQSVLARFGFKEDVREALARFITMLRDDGVLTTEKQRKPIELKNVVVEVARTTEVYSDIGRLHPEFREVWRELGSETLSSMPLGLALWNACRYITRAELPGAVVECGVWKGGSMMLAVRALLHSGVHDRPLYLYDIFDWSWEAPIGADGFFMSEDEQRVALDPSSSREGAPDDERWEGEVVDKLVALGYPRERIRTVRGRVQDTIPAVAPDQIALLRLDTDYYDSTRHELEQLYPRLVEGGVLLVDDYGRLEGATRAVDEFLATHGETMLLSRLDSQGCMGVKQTRSW